MVGDGGDGRGVGVGVGVVKDGCTYPFSRFCTLSNFNLNQLLLLLLLLLSTAYLAVTTHLAHSDPRYEKSWFQHLHPWARYTFPLQCYSTVSHPYSTTPSLL